MSEEHVFDPAWIVELFIETLSDDFPNKKKIINSLSNCTEAHKVLRMRLWQSLFYRA